MSIHFLKLLSAPWVGYHKWIFKFIFFNVNSPALPPWHQDNCQRDVAPSRPSVKAGELPLRAVRALCPPRCAALLPIPPSLIFPLLPLLVLLTAASSAVSTGHHPTSRSMSCLSLAAPHTELAVVPARSDAGDMLKWACTSKEVKHGHAQTIPSFSQRCT